MAEVEQEIRMRPPPGEYGGMVKDEDTGKTRVYVADIAGACFVRETDRRLLQQVGWQIEEPN
jgi:hypothetical protein